MQLANTLAVVSMLMVLAATETITMQDCDKLIRQQTTNSICEYDRTYSVKHGCKDFCHLRGLCSVQNEALKCESGRRVCCCRSCSKSGGPIGARDIPVHKSSHRTSTHHESKKRRHHKHDETKVKATNRMVSGKSLDTTTKEEKEMDSTSVMTEASEKTTTPLILEDYEYDEEEYLPDEEMEKDSSAATNTLDSQIESKLEEAKAEVEEEMTTTTTTKMTTTTEASPSLTTTMPLKTKRCRQRILKQFPDAVCMTTKDKDECKHQCENMGEENCQGHKGEIHKLNCKGEGQEGVAITCCCSIKCEAKNKTMERLEKEMDESLGTNSSGICVTTEPSMLRDKLKELCSKKDEVFIARKYCTEELMGKYFCVKNGKCFGTVCKGCLEHECEVYEEKQIFHTPQDYVNERLRLQDFTMDVSVNVDDMKDSDKLRKFCTKIESRKDCKPLCRQFGDRMCGSRKALKYDHEDACKRESDECQCCCQPVCEEDPDSTGSLLLAPQY